VVAAALPCVADENTPKTAALHELYSAHWTRAADAYREILRGEPAWGAGWDYLVRALIAALMPGEAYEAAGEALKSAPDTAGAWTAQGRALFRQGQLAKAEQAFRKAAALDKNYPYMMEGLARIYAAVARHKSAEALFVMAWREAPNDPELIAAWANTLKGADHIAALKRVLACYDPSSVEARRLRSHIATDETVGERRVRVLASEYRPYELNLVRILNGPQSMRGVGLRVRFNDSWEGRLLLDTGSSGIALSRKAAARAGFEALEQEGTEVHGIGERTMGSVRQLADEVRIGDLVLRNCPVSIFETARDATHDGLIGADVFSKFLVQLDWPAMKLRLTPYPGLTAAPEGSHDAEPLGAGFERVYLLAHILIPTFINDGSQPRLFVIDSGSTANLINVGAAREATKVHGDSWTIVHGVQGRAKEVSRADRVRLTFGGFRQDNADMIAVDLGRGSDDGGVDLGGLLGMPVLDQLAMTIDYRNAGVRLEYRKR